MNSTQRKLIGLAGITLIALALFIWLLICPLIGKIKQLSQEYLSKQEILAHLDQVDSLARGLNKSYQDREAELSIIKGILLTQEETVGFIATLEDIAQATGNIFEIKTAKSFAASEDGNGGTFLGLSIYLRGNFESLLLFLSNLEDSPYPPYRLLEIDSFAVNRLEDKSSDDENRSLEENDLETVLGIKIYTR